MPSEDNNGLMECDWEVSDCGARATFWASWADALHMIHERLPQLAATTVEIGWRARRWWMPHGVAKGCRRVGRQGFVGRPSWVDLQSGGRPPPSTLTELGEWAHCWQFYASSVSEHHFRKTVVLVQSCPSDQAHLRSHSGGGRSLTCSTGVPRVLSSLWRDVFRTIVLERLRLPLPVTEARCDCGALTDSRGRHWAACPHSGRLRTRAVAPEKTLARICREAAATVRANVTITKRRLGPSASDIAMTSDGTLPKFDDSSMFARRDSDSPPPSTTSVPLKSSSRALNRPESTWVGATATILVARRNRRNDDAPG